MGGRVLAIAGSIVCHQLVIVLVIFQPVFVVLVVSVAVALKLLRS